MRTLRDITFKAVLNARLVSGDPETVKAQLADEFNRIEEIPHSLVMDLFRHELSLKPQQAALKKAFAIVAARWAEGKYDEADLAKLSNLTKITGMTMKSVLSPAWTSEAAYYDLSDRFSLLLVDPAFANKLGLETIHEGTLDRRLQQSLNLVTLGEEGCVPVWEDLTVCSQNIIEHAFFGSSLLDVREGMLGELLEVMNVDSEFKFEPGSSYQLNSDGTVAKIS